MYWLLSAVLTGIVSYAATNIDDIFLLMLFFSQTGEEFRNWQVVLGQYLGVGALIGLSVLGSLGVLIVPEEWVGLLGLVPIFLGVRALMQLRSSNSEEERKPLQSSGIWGVASVTFANGGDNIGIYVPFLRALDTLARGSSS